MFENVSALFKHYISVAYVFDMDSKVGINQFSGNVAAKGSLVPVEVFVSVFDSCIYLNLICSGSSLFGVRN